MAGSIEDYAAIYKKKPFTYVPPSPPAELIESTSYTLDFAARKFVHVGIDPSLSFKIVVHILTSSRYVQITPDFLKKIFSYMGHILSFILDTPQKYKRVVFYEDEIIKLSSMVYSGENVLVLEAKTQEGCRVLLNRADLIRLQYLEFSIMETIVRKEVFTAPLIIKQYEEFVAYLDKKCVQHNSPPKNLDNMIIFIKNIQDDRVDKSIPNFTNQIQMCAAVQLSESVLNKLQNVQLDSPMSPSYSPIPNIPDTQDSHHSFNQPGDDILAKFLQAFDQLDGPSIPVDDIPQSVDENDGPDFYGRTWSTSMLMTPPSRSNCIKHPTPPRKRSHSTFTKHPSTVRDVKPRLF